MACRPKRVEPAVGRARGAASLHVAEDRGAPPSPSGTRSRTPTTARCRRVARARTRPLDPPFVTISRPGGALRDHDDRGVMAGRSGLDERAHLVDAKRLLGIRITLAPPAMPEWMAIQPACRPITSTISARWWLSAVVCSRSMASVAMFTAVSNPNV